MPIAKKHHNNDLLARIKLGDKQAFAQLFRQNFAMVTNYIRQFIKDDEASQDLAQDVFVKLWKYRTKLDPAFAPHGILKTISKRLVLNELRRISYSNQARIHYWNSVQVLRNTVEEQLRYEELLQLANHAITSLPHRQQEVFRLSRQEGLSHEEIASTLRISKSTVNNLLVRAIKTVKTALRESGGLLSVIPFQLWFFFVD